MPLLYGFTVWLTCIADSRILLSHSIVTGTIPRSPGTQWVLITCLWLHCWWEIRWVRGCAYTSQCWADPFPPPCSSSWIIALDKLLRTGTQADIPLQRSSTVWWGLTRNHKPESLHVAAGPSSVFRYQVMFTRSQMPTVKVLMSQ
jgi:hypothetical protein